MRKKQWAGWLWVGVAVALFPAQTAFAATPPSAEPVIQIEDVERFYRLYDVTRGHPTADQLQHDYLDAGTDGLHELAKVRNVTGASIEANLVKHPEVYSDAKRCTGALPRVRQRLKASLLRFGELYNDARFPPVTIAIGRGKPVGVGSPVSGVQIGLEALCATNWLNPNVEDRFVYVISHEYVHVQQVRELVDDENPTVLEMSLIEGAAEFVDELISGDVSYSQLRAVTKGHEKEIETAFQADMQKRDLSHWLYNSTSEKPGDLGYWVGYRIVKAYYLKATDKRQALRDIIGMKDPNAFLVASGWHPGMKFSRHEGRVHKS
ncbi:MAG TPA: DUF2268 domain-containing putative Zn-dependent protease [Dyella sp.]|uniref:DUF2268 domain-containing putative Zn-dependent protease n=1 Tax=Dyella sp. TaxID=1869338 RepID=UPI002F93A2CF